MDSGTFFDPNGDPLSFKVASLPTKGKVYQYTDSGPGAWIDAAGTQVTNASLIIFVPVANEYGVPYDSFAVTGSDGEFDTVSTYTISIVPAPIIQDAIYTNGPPAGFILSFTGVTNASYRVLRTDMGQPGFWFNAGPAQQISPGQFSFTDYTITNSAARFYRIKYP